MIKMEEIKQMPLEELKIKLVDLEEELSNLQFQHSLRQLDNPLKLRTLKKDIARVKTVIHEYELGIREEKKPQA